MPTIWKLLVGPASLLCRAGLRRPVARNLWSLVRDRGWLRRRAPRRPAGLRGG